MDPDAPRHQINDYIAANREKYTKEAIRGQLIAAGYDPTQVDLVLELEVGAARGGAPGSGLAGFAKFLFIFAAVPGMLGAALLMSGGAYISAVPAAPFLIAYILSYGGIGYGIVRLLRWAGPRFRVTGLWAALVGIALIPLYGVLMFGTCLGSYFLVRGA